MTSADSASATTTTETNAGQLPSTDNSGDHLALVYDAVFAQVRLYVNGQLADTSATWNNTWDLSTVSVQVGRTLTGATGSEYFSGALDDVRVFQGALDAGGVGLVQALPSGAGLGDSATT